ncbi:hypothetical protein [Pedobacter sp. GR22-10]|uniref:hypothetical protein n=1 Tax=Pedobacter sp. GR22-10 TaxID=2994472 RepID=UPI00224820D9|nr:hypothetical protein [Pedobacter sp. GR22-10]MCX2432191.1 hypothetical protein [Pedobacter sp. GR22-10]
MDNIHFFSRYTSRENFATNNTLLLLSRINLIDKRFFEKLLNALTDSTDLFIGPSFSQQKSTGGKGIPDGIIEQQSFKLVLETKLWDNNFWGKEEYVSHFDNEKIRILLTLSKSGIREKRRQDFIIKLSEYDSELKAPGRTIYSDHTFYSLIRTVREVIEDTKTRHKLELEEFINDYEGFIDNAGLLDDAQLRMYVPAINSSESDNIEYKLYYNRPHTNESSHRYIGLYKNKAIRYIAETKCMVIPRLNGSGIVEYEILKGELTDEMKARLERFFLEQGWGNKGEVKFHMFEEIFQTHFIKKSSYGIMGPRQFYLRDHIDGIPSSFDAKWIAEQLDKKTWE